MRVNGPRCEVDSIVYGTRSCNRLVDPKGRRMMPPSFPPSSALPSSSSSAAAVASATRPRRGGPRRTTSSRQDHEGSAAPPQKLFPRAPGTSLCLIVDYRRNTARRRYLGRRPHQGSESLAGVQCIEILNASVCIADSSVPARALATCASINALYKYVPRIPIPTPHPTTQEEEKMAGAAEAAPAAAGWSMPGPSMERLAQIMQEDPSLQDVMPIPAVKESVAAAGSCVEIIRRACEVNFGMVIVMVDLSSLTYQKLTQLTSNHRLQTFRATRSAPP